MTDCVWVRSSSPSLIDQNSLQLTQEDPSQSTPYTEHTVSFVQWAEINDHLVVCYLLYQTRFPPVLFNNPCSFTNINASFIFELYLRERLLQKKHNRLSAIIGSTTCYFKITRCLWEHSLSQLNSTGLN